MNDRIKFMRIKKWQTIGCPMLGMFCQPW